jgi:putative ABC transport system substrate-binding protein
MNRRSLLASMSAAALFPASPRAQSRNGTATAGFILSSDKAFAERIVETIMGGVREAGRPADSVLLLSGGDDAKLPGLTADLIARKVAVMLGDGPRHLRIAAAATRTVPIVAIDFEDDPVAAGYAASIARPGGNVTGIFLDLPDFTAKWIEFLRECMPRLSSVALMWETSTGPTQREALARAAAALGIRTELFEIRVRGDYAGALARAREHGAEAAILLSTPLIPSIVKELAQVSLQHRLPTITMFSDFVRSGGLISYGPNLFAAMHQVGVLMGKVIAGTSPGSLPIERPAKFELLANLQTARTFGLTLPPSILARADEVIE